MQCQVHKNGVGNKTGPHSLILILICTTTIIYLFTAREAPSVDIKTASEGAHQVGDDGWLYCIGTGIPEPTVQWRRVDGVPLSPRHEHQPTSPGYLM